MMTEELLCRRLPDGRVIDVLPLSFGRARVCLSDGPDGLTYERVY